MNCKNCGAPMSTVEGQEYLFCEYCAAFHFPKKSEDFLIDLGQEANFNCPVCKTILSRGSIEGHNVIHCSKCQGVLAHQQVFSSMIRLIRSMDYSPSVPPKPINPASLHRKLYCPVCGKKMDTHPYSGPGNVPVDICINCQLIWLDQGEISKIIKAPGRDRGRHI